VGRWRLPPLEHAELVADLNRRKNGFFEQARRAGRQEPDEAYLADALVDMARHPASARSGARGPADGDPDPEARTPPTRRIRWNQKVLIRVDGTAAARGEARPGERCEIAGVGPISGGDVSELLDSDALKAVVVTDPDDHTAVQTVAHLGRAPIDPATLPETIARAVADRGVDVVSLVHQGRRPTAAQVTAIEWISGGQSQIRGSAGGNGRLEIDHEPPWEQTHRTVLSELTLATGHEHDRKTYQGWTLGPLGPDGRRELSPPAPRAQPPPDTS
jgi:hypothetical protein